MKKNRQSRAMILPILLCVCFLSCPTYADSPNRESVKQEDVSLEEVTDYFGSLSVDEIGKNIKTLKGVQGEISREKMISEDTSEQLKKSIKKIPLSIVEMVKKDILWLALLLILSAWLFIRKLKEGKRSDGPNQDIE